MNIFSLYAILCYFSIALTSNDFPEQKIDLQNKQIIACTIPRYNTKIPVYCEIYYIKIHYEYNRFWYTFMTESLIFNKRGKCIYQNFEYNYDIDTNFNKIFKSIINIVDEQNEKTDSKPNL